MIKRGVAAPGSVPPPALLQAMLEVEKARLPPDAWLETIQAPGARWRLVFTADAKNVAAASKKQPNKGGVFFPLTAAQKFDAARRNFENGVFLGNLASLTFDGPYAMSGRQLTFDVHRMNLGVGPWRWTVGVKKGPGSLAEVGDAERKKLPFFLYAYADGEWVEWWWRRVCGGVGVCVCVWVVGSGVEGLDGGLQEREGEDGCVCWRRCVWANASLRPSLHKTNTQTPPTPTTATRLDEIIVARGRSGGLAVWTRATPTWQMESGVAAVYK